MPHRDLACEEFWNESLERSRRRRAAQARSHAPERMQRGAAVATAAVVLGAAPAAAAVGSKALSGGGSGISLDAKVEALSDEMKGRAEPRVPAPEPMPTPSAAPQVATSTSTPSSQPAPVKREATTETGRKAPGAPEAPSVPAAAKPEGTATVASAATADEVDPAGKPAGGVQELQQALGVPVDGDFGSTTERALKRWQKKHGMPADGIAGDATRAALDLGTGPTLKPEAKPHRRAKAGRRPAAIRRRGGGGVRSLQAALGLGADGVFGPATERALKRWQRAHGLTPDGVAGPQTRAKLGLASGRPLKRAHRTRHGGRRGGGGGGGSSSVIQRVIAAGNAIATKPYRYGGGHGSFNDSGYDCSGSVSYALHGGGLLSSPLDSSAFMSYGSPGPGRHITIYANPGHVYMIVNGRRFDTSSHGPGGSRWSGIGRSAGGYTVRHPAGY